MSALTDRVDALHIRTTSDLAKLTDALRSEAALTGCPISKAQYKTEIQYLTPSDQDQLSNQLLQTRLASYRYTASGPQGRRHLGFIIDDDPHSPAVDPERDMVDLYGYLSMAVATIQNQQRQIDQLQQQIKALREALMPYVELDKDYISSGNVTLIRNYDRAKQAIAQSESHTN